MKKLQTQLATHQISLPVEVVERRIYLVRGLKVMLDRDLAALYGVKPIALRQQVKRNQKRFPDDFRFKLTLREAEALVSQNVIPSRQSLGGYLPDVFTEQGVAMLSSVLNSERAVQVNIVIMRAFVKLRDVLATHKDLSRKLTSLERKYQKHDSQINEVFDAIRQLIETPKASTRRKRRIGYLSKLPRRT